MMCNNLVRRNGKSIGRLLCGFVVGSLFMIPGNAMAQAGGLALPEDGGPINGTAQAGSAAVARDAQTAYLNPAGMTRLEGGAWMASIQPFKIDMDFNKSSSTTATGPDGGDQGDWFVSGGLFLAVPLNEDVWLGFSVTAPAGMGIEPDDDWAGRYYTTKTELAVLNLEPSIGFRINEQWSIGGGVDVQYADFEQDMKVNLPGPGPDREVGIDGDSWEVGFSLSALYEPTEDTRFGLRYRSEIDHDLEGDLIAFTSVPVSTGLTIPQSLTLSGYHDINETWAIMADVGWQEWSAFDRTSININGTSGTQVEIPRNFDDTWTVSVGAHYRPVEDWLVMFGAGYTSSAVDDEDRTPDLPVDEQVRASIGVEYDLNSKWDVGANYTFIWLGDNEVNTSYNASTGRLDGDYDAYIHIFGFYASAGF